MNDKSKDLGKTLEEGLAELERIADEIRVRIHLGGMDAKDAWNKLEPRIDEAREHATKAATDASHKIVEDVTQALKKLRASL